MIRCCEKCAHKLEAAYIVTDEGGRCSGFCPLCFAATVTQRWEITPRRVRYPRPRSGGGERARAGR